MKYNWRLVVGSLIFLLLLTHWAANSWLLVGGQLSGSYDGWSGKLSQTSGVITQVDPAGPASALRVGDEILALNGIPANAGNPNLLRFNTTVPPGTRYTMQVRRAGQVLDVPLQTVAYYQRRLSLNLVWNLLIYLIFLLVGAVLFFLARHSGQFRQVWLLALMFWTLTGITGTENISALPRWLTIVMIAARVVAVWFLPVFLHFFLIFPAPSPLLRRFPWLERRLYWPFYLGVLPSLGLTYLPQAWLGETVYRAIRHPWLFGFARFLILAYVACGLLSLLINYRAADKLERRRLRVIAAGSGLGFFNLLLMPLGDYTGLMARFPQLWNVFSTCLFFTLPLIPLSFAYAIIRHKVLPVSLLIRRGVRYLLVSRGALLLVGLIVALSVAFDLWLLFRYLNPSGLTIALVSAGVAITAWNVTAWAHRRYLAPVIDRRFFRQSYDAQQILAELTESLRRVTDLPQLLQLAATKIQAALQTENVTIFLRDAATGDYHSQYSCAYSAADGQAVNCQHACRLPAQAACLKQLSDNGEAMAVEPILSPAASVGAGAGAGAGGDAGAGPAASAAAGAWQSAGVALNGASSPHAGVALNGASSPHSALEQQTLREVNAALLLPLNVKDELLGVISLGPRLGDLPFSSEDKRLLLSVAAPSAFALENARLVERLVEDARRREELEAENEARARELEEARQLQLSMLPKTLPQLPHLEIAAYMKTATEVGGDYYDFHLSSDGTLTIAVGDATGHGLKAGTVVTAMKSLFHSYAREPELVSVFNQSSHVLKAMNLRSLFMALTMAKLNGHTLTLASAGMPPALIYRHAADIVEEVLMKTMPLGSVRDYPYHDTSFELAPGDVVVLMSDGFPERFNAAGEMLGYDQAREVLAQSAALPPTQIVERFVATGDAWAGVHPQDDDVTFVVLKLKA